MEYKKITADEAATLANHSNKALSYSTKAAKENAYFLIREAAIDGRSEIGISFVKYANLPFGNELIQVAAEMLSNEGYKVTRHDWDLNVKWGIEEFYSYKDAIEKIWKED